MTDRNYELRLVGLPMPDGQLRFADLAAVASGLQLLMTRIARRLTGHESQGRAPALVEAASILRCTGLLRGPTVLAFELGDPMSPAAQDGLDDRVADRFDEVLASLPAALVPGWVTPSVADAVADLVSSISATGAGTVGVERNGAVLLRTAVDGLDSGPWRVSRERTRRAGAVTGVLFAVDVRSRRFRLTDDVGNDIALVDVAQAQDAARLVTGRVLAEGTAEYDDTGQLRRLTSAIVRAAEFPAEWRGPLRHVAAIEGGLLGDGIEGLTDEDVDAFLAGR